MKTTFTRTIAVSIALELAQGIIEKACQDALVSKEFCSGPDCPSGQCWSCPNRNGSEITPEGIFYRPDVMSGDNMVSFPAPDTVVLLGAAMSGNHSLAINVATGHLTVTHDGVRRSYPGNAMDLLIPKWVCNHDGSWSVTGPAWNNLCDAAEWQLVDYQSSEPEWAAIAGFLSGVAVWHKGLPTNKKEADNLLILKPLIEKAALINKEIPNDIFVENGKMFEGDYVPYKVKWNALDYRRACAMGIQL